MKPYDQMPTIIKLTLPTTSNTTLHIHEPSDVSDSSTGRALTGSWTWDSAFILSDYIITQFNSQEFTLLGKTVLELGAGTGLPGLTAARLGATRVVLTDIPALLPGLRMNVEVNGMGDRVEVRELVWGSEEFIAYLIIIETNIFGSIFVTKKAKFASGSRFQTIEHPYGLHTSLTLSLENWTYFLKSYDAGLQTNVEVNEMVDRIEVCELVSESNEFASRVIKRVDLVLMSDIFYDVEEMAALVRTLVAICGPKTSVWAASEVRETTNECLDELGRFGFGVSEVVSLTRLSRDTGFEEVFKVYELVPPK